MSETYLCQVSDVGNNNRPSEEFNQIQPAMLTDFHTDPCVVQFCLKCREGFLFRCLSNVDNFFDKNKAEHILDVL